MGSNLFLSRRFVLFLLRVWGSVGSKNTGILATGSGGAESNAQLKHCNVFTSLIAKHGRLS